MTCYTQFEEGSRGEPCDLVLGLDFGTSCTKVVLQDPHRYRQIFLVPFGEAAHRISEYLLPSALWLGPEGELSLTPVSGGSHLRDIKDHFVQEKDMLIGEGRDPGASADILQVTAAFLALALRSSRRWFMQEQRTLYHPFQLHWQVNLGLPSADFQEQSLCRRYLKVAAAGWHLSLGSKPLTLQCAEEALGEVALEADSDGREIGGEVVYADDHFLILKLIPEVAAEVAGYARSSRRDEGLHVLVDVGATTVDICSFVLRNCKGEDCYDLLTADVQPLGTMHLHRQRLASVQEVHPDAGRAQWQAWDPVEPIPQELSGYVAEDLRAKQSKKLCSKLRWGDRAYRKRIEQMIWKTLVDLKVKRFPLAPRWQTRMPVFLAGGASYMPLYQEALNNVCRGLQKRYAPCKGLDPMKLPQPEGVDSTIFSRLAVAWGLSYPDMDIGVVARPEEWPDAPIREREPPTLYVGKEMV